MTEELNLLREALRRVKHEAASLADAQVIALEALTAPAAEVPEQSTRLRAAAVPEGWVQVPLPITEDMHVAAVKVLQRADGLDGLPQRMLRALITAAPPAPEDGREVVRDAVRKALEDLEDAAEEWARYVEVDTAPCTLPKYLAPHVENVLAALSAAHQATKEPSK